MVQRKGGNRRKTRSIFKRNIREKGKLSVSKFFQEFSNGDKVVLKANPSYQKGLYFRRFHGRLGTVVGKSGSCYEVSIGDKNKTKLVVVHPIHLVRSN